jgi:hypothetical protein
MALYGIDEICMGCVFTRWHITNYSREILDECELDAYDETEGHLP